MLATGAFGAATNPQPGSGQTIRGLALERGDGEPVAIGRVVMISERGDSVASTLTDERGYFSLTSPDPGAFIIRVTAPGYRPERAGPFDIETDDERVVQVSLVPLAIGIEGLIVQTDPIERAEATLLENGFYERMQSSRGQFLTPEDIANSDAMFTPGLFEDLDHVVRQYTGPPWQEWVKFRNAVRKGDCTPRFFTDGVRLRGAGPGTGLDDVVPIEALMAAEVYWGPFQAPLEYLGTSQCGVILLWTWYGR